MKKLLSVLMAMMLFVGTISATVFAEPEIKGLEENLDELLIRNYFTQEELAKMENEYMEYYSEFAYNTIIPGRREMGKMETGSVEEEHDLIMEQVKINIENGLRVSHFLNGVYSDQYAREGCFEYLFSGKEYWRAPLVRTKNGDSRTCYQINGERFGNTTDNTWTHNLGLIAQDRILRIVEDKSIIENLLLQKGEKEVQEIKICALANSRPGLYIKCLEQEYFLKTHDLYDIEYKLQDDTYYEFTTMMEATQEYEQYRHDRSESYVTPVKATFDAEAEALQAEGLLLGTEKGLELLKPLTRAEAATILLRAMGESTEGESATTQTFADVSPAYWGYGAVENSYKLGIMNGIGNNLFAPEDMVTAAQFSTMVLRASDYGEFNWEEALDILIANSVISLEDASAMDFFTRGDMAKIIYEAREKGIIQ